MAHFPTLAYWSNKACCEGPHSVYRVCRIPAKSHLIYLENSTPEVVIGVGIYQMKMQTYRKLILCDVLYASGIQQKPTIHICFD